MLRIDFRVLNLNNRASGLVVRNRTGTTMRSTNSEIPIDLPHAKRLLAAEGYIELGMYAEAGAELDALEDAYSTLEETLVLQLCVLAGLKQWKEAHALSTALGRRDP